MSAPTRSILRRLAGLTSTLAVVALAAGGTVAGVNLIADRAAALPPPPAAPLTPVASLSVRMEPGYTVDRRFTGQIEAVATSDVGFEFGGRLTEVLADEGDHVPAGTVLARTDISTLLPQRAALEAELAALAADAERARLALSRADTLAARGHASEAAQDDARLTLARTEAGMAARRAQIAGIDVQIAKSEVRAPFDARVGARLADPGQAIGAGQPVLRLFDATPARLRVGVPPHLAMTLPPGGEVRVLFSGQEVTGRILQIRPDLDPVTRSRAVIVALPPGLDPAFGETATLVLPETVAERGFWAPLSALKEGARGSWTVMAVEARPDGDAVVPAAVEVIHAADARVFLRGALPPGNRIVGEAASRVAPGQMVLVLASE
jgi:membrane fusion protein, multidrug efflux system